MYPSRWALKFVVSSVPKKLGAVRLPSPVSFTADALSLSMAPLQLCVSRIHEYIFGF